MKHLLIDFENIQPLNLDNIPHENTHIWLFLGIHQKQLSIELVQSLLRFGERVHFIRLKKSGKNALDFYLSYYLGQVTATDPLAMIIILSGDGGYDVLVEHITTNQHVSSLVRWARLDEVQLMPKLIEHQNVMIEAEQVFDCTQPETNHLPITFYFQAALTALRAPKAFRPTRLHNLQLNLRNHILRDWIMYKNVAEQESIVEKVINQFKTKNLIQINEHEWIVYQLDDADILSKIQRYILHIKPKTLVNFQKAIEQRAKSLCLTVQPNDVQEFIRHLCKQGLIRQNNDQIEYPPFTKRDRQPETKLNKYQPDKIILDKIMKTTSQKNRPNKISSLKNTIKAMAKGQEAEVEAIFQYLQDKKHIQVNENKIIYLK